MNRYDDAISKAQEILESGNKNAIEQLKQVIEEYEKRR